MPGIAWVTGLLSWMRGGSTPVHVPCDGGLTRLGTGEGLWACLSEQSTGWGRGVCRLRPSTQSPARNGHEAGLQRMLAAFFKQYQQPPDAAGTLLHSLAEHLVWQFIYITSISYYTWAVGIAPILKIGKLRLQVAWNLYRHSVSLILCSGFCYPRLAIPLCSQSRETTKGK